MNFADTKQKGGYKWLLTERIVIDDSGAEIPWVYRMGTDTLGRDVYSRVMYGAQVSLLVGVSVAALSVLVGLAIGLVAGYIQWVDRIVMRVMDGLMAIPGILLAIALVSLWGAMSVPVLQINGLTVRLPTGADRGKRSRTSVCKCSREKPSVSWVNQAPANLRSHAVSFD